MVRIEACSPQLPLFVTYFYLDTGSLIQSDLQLINVTAQAVYGGETANHLCEIVRNCSEKYELFQRRDTL